MRLTQKQEWLVARYMRAVGDELSDLPERMREQAIAHVKTRIKRELKSFTTSPLRDPQVVAVLQRLGPPGEQAAALRQTPGANPVLVLSVTDCVWLGVCGGIAEYWELDPIQVRFCAVVVGLMLGPLALIGYLALYFEMYNATRKSELRERVAQINAVGVFQAVSGTLLAVVALNLAARLALVALGMASEYLAVRPQLGFLAWEWLRAHNGLATNVALLFLTPVAVLAGLPLPSRWAELGKRFIHAVVAIYAVVLCFGIALNTVGVILQVVARFSISQTGW